VGINLARFHPYNFDVKRVGVIGQGYVGLAVATAAADAGYFVTGFDTNPELIKKLRLGNSHIEDIDDELLQKLIENSMYRPSNLPEDLHDSDVVIIAVPTPLSSDRKPDLSYVNLATETIINYIKESALIISESTSYPGTLRKLIAEKINVATGISHRYAVAPERIDPGNEKWRLDNTPRIVAGLNIQAGKEAVDFYSTFTDNVKLVSTPEVAEMAKLVENSFRYVNIAFVNELAQIADGFKVNINEVLEAAQTKPYGFMRFFPGGGVGGHCIPIDPIYLSHESKKLGMATPLIDKADEINLYMPRYVLTRVLRDHNQNIKGKKVLIVGVSYKADISDTRETPALAILKLLKESGANCAWHDPLVETFNGEFSIEIGHQDIAIILNLHQDVEIEKLRNINYVFDCTGKLTWAHSL